VDRVFYEFGEQIMGAGITLSKFDTRMTRRYAHISRAHIASAIGQLEKSYGEFSSVKRKRATT
jgi:hypothetical protein